MKIKTLLSLFFVMMFSAACPSGIDPVNPYDPDTPTADKAKATLTGTILIEGNGDVTQVEILVAGLTGHPAQDGTFTVKGIPPTIQEVLFRLDGYEDVRQSRLFSPGSTEEMNVRIQVMRGSVVGSVLLQEQNDHSGVTVVLVPSNDTQGSFQLAALTATGGNYVFDSVPVGTYRLSASKPHYMGKVVNDIKVDPYGISQVPRLELPPVTGAVEILGGDPEQEDPFVNPDYPACCPNNRFTRTTQVLLHTEGFNAVRMKASQDQPSLQRPEGWETYQTEQTFELSELNGSKTIYVLLEDANGVRSDVLEGHTVLDTQAPSIMDLVLGDGSGYTSESTISVSAFADDLPAESGIAEMRMEAETTPSPDTVWQPYQLRAPFVLPLQDGEHQIFVELRDRAGNRAQVVSGTIRLDRQEPHPVEGMQPVVVHNGSGYALGMDVPIYINVTDEVTPPEDMKMVLCETEGCAGMPFSPFAHQTIMSFSSEGMHTVYAMFKDGAGNVFSPEGVTFEIDTTAPTFPVVSVEEGSSVTSGDIHLLIDVSGADQILLSDSAELPTDDDPRWTAFQTRMAYDIGQAEGEHLVFVYARDFAGHMTGPAMAMVELDTTPPAGTIHIQVNQDHCNGTQCYTNSESALVQVAITSADDTSSVQMRLSIDDVFDEPLQAYSPLSTVLLTGDQSIFQHVHAQLVDEAGNTTQIVSDNAIRLDLEPPNIPVISTNPSNYSSVSTGIVLHLDNESQDDISGVDHYEYLVDPLISTWEIFDEDNDRSEIVDLDDCQSSSCQYTFKVRAVDMAGNIGDPSIVQLVLDTNNPNTPKASVTPSSIDKGPRIINADAVSVWVQTEDSNDDNFDQFQVRIRTCPSGFNPNNLTCDGGWNAWSSWRDTGVGKGGREILAVLASQDSVNQIQVRGRDLAGNTSAEDSVIFTEDSLPPSLPILYPETAEVNADSAVLYMSSPAQDENIDTYECTINREFNCLFWDGTQWTTNNDSPSSLPSGIREIKIPLAQDAINTVRIRAFDKAGNYSQTFETSITENSTIYDAPIQITARSANRLEDRAYTFSVNNIESMDMDSGLLATSFWGQLDDNSYMSGLLINDLNSNRTSVFASSVTDVHVEHQQIVGSVSVFELCNNDLGPVDNMYDSADNTDLPKICDCVINHDCAAFSGTRVYDLLHDYTYEVQIPVLIDMSRGEPAIQVIHTSSPTVLGIQNPLYLQSNNIRNITGFDGIRFAWIDNGETTGNLSRFTINVTELSSPSGGLCNPSTEFCVANFVRQREFSNMPKVGRVVVTDKVAAWTEFSRAQDSHIMVYDYVNDIDPWDIGYNGIKFDPEMREPMTADCFWDAEADQPVCRHLFWVDKSTMTPIVKVLDLENPGALLTDDLHNGIAESHSMSAEDGKVAWLDTLEGTKDVFFLDLDDPEQCDPTPEHRNCLGHEKIIVRSSDEETELAMSGQMVPYWRRTGAAIQLHISDAGSRPWFFARPGLHAFSKVDQDKVALGFLDASNPDVPYNVGSFDKATHNLRWMYGGKALALPVAIRDLGNEEALTYFTTDDNGHFVTQYTDSSTGQTISLLKNASEMGIPENPNSDFYITGSVGDKSRTMWMETEIWSHGGRGNNVILDCDMDPNGAAPCQANQFRILFKINSVVGGDRAAVCSMGVDGDVGVLILMENNDNAPHYATAYRLDMAALDSRSSPIEPSTIHGLEGEQGIDGVLFGGSDITSRYDLQRCSDFMDNRVAIDASSQSYTIALARSSNICTRCQADNPNTYFIENCSSPPCCGDWECDCANSSCDDTWQNANKICIADSSGPCLDVVSNITFDSTVSLGLRNGFLVWKSRNDGPWFLMIKNLVTDYTWKLFKNNKDVTFPYIYEQNGSVVLMWSEASMGPMQIFNTVLSF